MHQVHPMTDYWDQAFLQEIEDTTIDEGVLIWALSGPSFALRTPHALLLIDPFLGGDFVGAPAGMYRTTAIPIDPANIQTADAVLMTHNHYDHCHEETVLGIASSSTATFYGPVSVVRDLLSFGVPEERTQQIRVGDEIRIADADIAVWPGNDPGEPEAVCYTIQAGGIRIFFAGDSLAGPYLDQVGAAMEIDIAMLAFGRTWYMSEAEILEAAARLHPKVLLPYHWDLWRGHTGDPVALGRLVERQQPSFAVELLLIGQALHYLPGGGYSRLF